VTRSRTPSNTELPPWPATVAGMKTIFHRTTADRYPERPDLA
jgi:hypothetical protein